MLGFLSMVPLLSRISVLGQDTQHALRRGRSIKSVRTMPENLSHAACMLLWQLRLDGLGLVSNPGPVVNFFRPDAFSLEWFDDQQISFRARDWICGKRRNVPDEGSCRAGDRLHGLFARPGGVASASGFSLGVSPDLSSC